MGVLCWRSLGLSGLEELWSGWHLMPGSGELQGSCASVRSWHCLGFPSLLNHPFLSPRVRPHHDSIQETMTKSGGPHREDNQNSNL